MRKAGELNNVDDFIFESKVQLTNLAENNNRMKRYF